MKTYRIYDKDGYILKQSQVLNELIEAVKLISLYDKQLEMSVWLVNPEKDVICEDNGGIINEDEVLVGTCWQGVWHYE